MDLYWADGTTTQTETTPHMLTNAGRSKKKAIVSFVDCLLYTSITVEAMDKATEILLNLADIYKDVQ